ncbi:MAG: preprotein translocase subunit SecA, partial [Armatimonadetes bacterium]|nr:preprotein translocase subunit SecA [Armatimonadota bacterium]
GTFCPDAQTGLDWDLDGLYKGLDEYFPLSLAAARKDLDGQNRADLEAFLVHLVEEAYAAKEAEINDAVGDPEAMRNLERHIALQVINQKWMEHLANMDYLREGINLRGYGQQDPLVVYNKEAFQMFEDMQQAIQDEIARYMFHVQYVQERQQPRRHYQVFDEGDGSDGGSRTAVAKARKLGRNDPCHCGSGKKYKHCHYPD